MDQDPNSPDYQPDVTGPDPTSGTPGSGADFGADLFALYRAGRVLLPELATRFGEAAETLHLQVPSLETERGRVAPEGGSAVSAILDIHHLLQDHLRTTTVNVRDAGTALVQIADRYAATDAAANAEFNRLLDQAQGAGELDDPTPEVETPPASTDPQPPPPSGPHSGHVPF